MTSEVLLQSIDQSWPSRTFTASPAVQPMLSWSSLSPQRGHLRILRLLLLGTPEQLMNPVMKTKTSSKPPSFTFGVQCSRNNPSTLKQTLLGGQRKRTASPQPPATPWRYVATHLWGPTNLLRMIGICSLAISPAQIKVHPSQLDLNSELASRNDEVNLSSIVESISHLEPRVCLQIGLALSMWVDARGDVLKNRELGCCSQVVTVHLQGKVDVHR